MNLNDALEKAIVKEAIKKIDVDALATAMAEQFTKDINKFIKSGDFVNEDYVGDYLVDFLYEGKVKKAVTAKLTDAIVKGLK